MRKHPAHKERAQERKRCIKAKKTGWRPHVQATFDTISAQRRPLTDPLGLQRVLLAAAGDGPVRFGELVEHGGVPAAARAQALHLI